MRAEAGDTEPANYFAVVPPVALGGMAGVTLRTSLFLVAGKEVTPTLAPTDPVPAGQATFGQVAVAASATTRVFTLSNVLQQSITGFAVSIVGADAAQFAVSATTCSAAAVVPANGACTVTVAFTPAGVVGTKVATLQVTFHAVPLPAAAAGAAGAAAGGASLQKHSVPLAAGRPGGVVSLALSAVEIPPPAPLLALYPPSLIFPSILPGETSAPTDIYVQNGGTATLEISAFDLVSNEFRVSEHTCVTPLEPGQQCKLTLLFSPREAGVCSGMVTVSSNAATAQILLSGLGSLPEGFLVGDVPTVLAPYRGTALGSQGGIHGCQTPTDGTRGCSA